MGRIVVVENLSLDGVMQSPGQADGDTRGGFDRGGWASAAMADDPQAAEYAMTKGGPHEAMLFGRRTYQDVVGHWLSTPEPNPFTDFFVKTQKYVATRTLSDPLPYPNSTAVRAPDAIGQIAELRERAEDAIVVLGSGDLVRQLAAAHLIDSYVLTIIPVVLGNGSRLFGDTYADLEVLDSFTSPTGIVVHHLGVR